MIPTRTLHHIIIKSKAQQSMARKRSNHHTTTEPNLHAGPATMALESAIQIMEEFEANEQKKRGPSKGFPERFDSTSVESALFGFPRIGWQTGEHSSQHHQNLNHQNHHVTKKQMLEQVREQLNLHRSPSNLGHHHGLVRCIYFASDLSETAGVEENPAVLMEDGSQDSILIMAD